MKESDYIRATNLVKIRIAKDVVRDILPIEIEDKLAVATILGILRNMESKIENEVLKEEKNKGS